MDREELLELIEVALVELKGIVQPHEVAHFRELLLDARESETSEQRESIFTEVKSLRAFCEKRAKSRAGFPATLPRGRRR